MNGRRLTAWLGAALLLAALSSCSVTRHIPSGEYLLNRTEIKIERDHGLTKKELVTQSELDKYVRQHPAKRFLGTNLPSAIYVQANPKRNTWWNRLKKRIGREPVLLDTAQTRATAEGMKIYMDSRGFLNSSSSFTIDTLKRKARVTYLVNQGAPYRLGTIDYRFRDDFVRSVILSDTAASLLRSGNIFDVNVLDRERARITDDLKNRGYYNFSINNISYVADSVPGERIINLTMVVRRSMSGYDAEGEAILENNQIYRIRNIYVFSNYNPTVAATDSLYERRLDTLSYKGLNIIYDMRENVRPEILRRAVSLYPNYLYNAEAVQRTYDNLIRLGYYRTANILFTESADSTAGDNLVTFVGDGADTADGAAYTSERYLDCKILCTPTTRQSYSVDLEGAFSDDYFALIAKVGYQNRNLFRGAGLFDASIRGGYEFLRKGGADQRNNSFEVGASVSFSFPKLITPFPVNRYNRAYNPRTKIELSYSIQDRRYYHRTLSGITWGYQWGNRKRSTFTLRPVDISIIKLQRIDETFLNSLNNPYLKQSYQSQVIAGLSGSYLYSTQQRGAQNGYLNMRFNYETNGNLLSGLYGLFGAHKVEADAEIPDPGEPVEIPEKTYRIFGTPFAQYFRVDANIAKQFVLGEKTRLVYRFYAGWGFAYGNSVTLPYDRMFYSGGINSMRGWVARTLGPGNSEPWDNVAENDPNGSNLKTFPRQVGNFKLETNLEFRFPVWGFLHGGVFCDVGNIWFARQGTSLPEETFRFDTFYRQLGFNTGLGLRFDFNFFVFRVDWGIQLHNPNQPAGKRWVIKNFHLKNTSLNFGVGYPF